MSNDTYDSVATFMDWVRARHPGDDEYHQAVTGVIDNVLPLVRDDEAMRRAAVLERLTEPDRIVSFRVSWESDDGAVQLNRGYRVQHCNAIGPYKGGIRFDAGVTAAVLKFLSFEQTFKNSLTGLNLGGGKGGADFDPKDRSDREIMRFCQAFMTELARHIGPETDVPAGDIGVGAREIGYLFGQYKRLENRFAGALTGKALDYGGSELREEATGYGVLYFLCHMLGRDNASVAGKRIAISGAGNVAGFAAAKAIELGARVVTLSGRDGCLVAPDGLSADDVEIVQNRRACGDHLDEIAASIGARFESGKKPWHVPCDVAIPAATQNELDGDDAVALIDNGCAVVVEGANMPLTAEARQAFDDAKVPVAPGKAANAGGVAVSGLEMTQNRLGRRWSRDRMDRELRDLMGRIHDTCVASAGDGDVVDYAKGADRAGFKRVARALVAFGVV